MLLTFLGKDSHPKQSPTLFATDRDSYVVQGYIVTDPEILAMIVLRDEETIVEVPAALMAHLAKDGRRSGAVRDRSARWSLDGQHYV